MPDLPGFGGVPAREGVTMDDYARAALEALDAEGVDRAVFAGISMGGYVCFSALRLFPERISGLVLIDTRETADSHDARKQRFESIEQVKRDGVKPLVDAMLPKMLTPAAPQSMRNSVRQIMMSTSSEGAVAALRAMAERPDSTEVLPRISVPTLIVVGEQDPIATPADADRMAHHILNARVVKLPHAAHLSNVEQADAFNRAVQNHL
jgi:3-oxoadipate enol-lactonase